MIFFFFYLFRSHYFCIAIAIDIKIKHEYNLIYKAHQRGHNDHMILHIKCKWYDKELTVCE